MTDQEISELISYVQLLWPHGREVDRREQIVAWREQLADVPALAGRAAVDELAAAGREHPPPPGVIRRRALFLASGADAPTVEQAWNEVLETIQRQPHSSTTYDTCPRWRWKDGPACPLDCPHRHVTFSHPAIQATVDGLGYRDLCASSETMADRAHFLKLYPITVERLARQVSMPRSVAALEAARPLAELGPPAEPVRALPSAVMDEPRDDAAGLAELAKVREVIDATRATTSLPDEGDT